MKIKLVWIQNTVFIFVCNISPLVRLSSTYKECIKTLRFKNETIIKDMSSNTLRAFNNPSHSNWFGDSAIYSYADDLIILLKLGLNLSTYPVRAEVIDNTSEDCLSAQ